MKVTMYKANDGSLHETQKACDAKNVELRTAPLVEDFVNSLNAMSTGVTVDTDRSYVDLADLPGFIVAHADALRTLLNKAVNPVGRPRKGAEPKERKPRAKKGNAANAGGQDSRTDPTAVPTPDKAEAVVTAAANVAASASLDDVLAALS